MYYEIAEVTNEAKTGRLYVLVDFWKSKADHDASKPRHLTEEFIIQGSRVKLGGKDEVHSCIQNYWGRAVEGQWSGDHTRDVAKPFYIGGKQIKLKQDTLPIERDTKDPDGLLVKEITDLRAAKVTAEVSK